MERLLIERIGCWTNRSILSRLCSGIGAVIDRCAIER
jgi:hypothetical protein